MINKAYGLLGIAAKSGNIISGTDVVLENIRKKNVKLVIIAKDSSKRSKENMKNKCCENNVPIVEFGTIEENSKYIGKENRAIIGVIENKLAIAILNKISGGESFGEN